MAAPIIPDFSTANADLDELKYLSRLHGFDLFEFLRRLSEAGAPALTCKVDHVPTEGACGRIAQYKLSEALLTVLSALRARHVDMDEVEGCTTHVMSPPK